MLKSKLLAGLVGLLLCGVLVLSSCAPLPGGNLFEDKLANWLENVWEKWPGGNTTEDAKDDSVTEEYLGNPIYNNDSTNYVCSFEKVNDGVKDMYIFYVGFTGLKADQEYRVYWDASPKLFMGDDLERYVTADEKYAMFYFFPGETRELHAHGATSSVSDFDELYRQGSMDITTTSDGAFYIGFWMAPIGTPDSEAEVLSASIFDSVTLNLYEID